MTLSVRLNEASVVARARLELVSTVVDGLHLTVDHAKLVDERGDGGVDKSVKGRFVVDATAENLGGLGGGDLLLVQHIVKHHQEEDVSLVLDERHAQLLVVRRARLAALDQSSEKGLGPGDVDVGPGSFEVQSVGL